MTKLTYTPDEDVQVHGEGAIRLICQAFQSHESGLPEWPKNSADAYVREDADAEKRVILLVFDFGRKSIPASISCIDFCGMTTAMIEQRFRIWADPNAAAAGSKGRVQGGHGNGGKCYMTQMFQEYAIIESFKNGKGNRYGVEGGTSRFGYVPDPARGKNFPIRDLKNEFNRILEDLGLTIDNLPPAVHEAFYAADGLTLVKGVGPKGITRISMVEHLVSKLQEHPQMIRTLELCKLFVVSKGIVLNGGQPLSLPEITPISGYEEPVVIPIPQKLRDPETDEKVETSTNQDSQGKLILRTSAASMRYHKKGRHNIIYKANSDYIGYKSIPEFDIQSAYRDQIYGGCELDSLQAYKQNERGPLANSPLTRAVENFIGEQIQTFAREFESRDRRRYDQQERSKLSQINEALDKWKNKFLKEFLEGLWGKGEGETVIIDDRRLPSATPTKIELTISHQKAGIGVAFRPTVKFYDSAGRHVRPVPYEWVSDDPNVAMVHEDLMIINTFSYGRTNISARTLDGRVESNSVPLDVVHIQKIDLSPAEVDVSTGSKAKINAVCKLTSGEETTDVYLVWTESNPAVAKVSSSGMVYGFSPGDAEVIAGDDNVESSNRAKIKVVSGEKGKTEGERPGRGFPRILISGEIDKDPETGEYLFLSKDHPPVYQGPQDVDRNIWWINSASPLARMFLDRSLNYGTDSREWRMYHLERIIEIMVQIAMTNGPEEDQSLSVGEWILRWGDHAAQIHAAAVSDLRDFIQSGTLPENI